MTVDRLLIQRQHRQASPTVAYFGTAAKLRIAGAMAGTKLVVRLSLLEIGGPSRAPVILAYDYALEDRHGVELLAFHHHLPDARGQHPRPHVHVSAALRPRQPNGDRGLVPLDKLHLPTGRVTLGDIVSMPVEEFGAEPRAADWRQRLTAAGTPFA